VKLLLTGFEPFGNWTINPTQVAVNELNNYSIGRNSSKVYGKVIPLEFHNIKSVFLETVSLVQPSAIIMSGQAGGDAIRLEKIARNYVKNAIPYNCGTVSDGQVLIEDAPEFLETTLPLEDIYNALNEEDIPVKLSDSAGSFGCNLIFYYGQYYLPSIPSGFIHVPLLKNQVKEGDPYLEQDTITKALRITLEIVTKWVGNKSHESMKGESL
jgi:pyroglutamyl-peptidase